MGNSSYLCLSDDRLIYPSSRDGYQADSQTIATDAGYVPLMWMVLFRGADMMIEDFGEPGEPYIAQAPIVEREHAIVNLTEAVPYLTSVFAGQSVFEGYAQFLRETLETERTKFITIEMDEIACLSPTYYGDFRAVLNAVGIDASDQARSRLIELTGLRQWRSLPPPNLFTDALKPGSDDMWNMCRVLGTSLYKDVPWEQTAKATSSPTASDVVEDPKEKSFFGRLKDMFKS